MKLIAYSKHDSYDKTQVLKMLNDELWFAMLEWNCGHQRRKADFLFNDIERKFCTQKQFT